MTEEKDLVIIGAGPAGITAAVYAARKRMDFCVISGDVGGQAAWSGDIENYTGYQFITGPDLALKFREHLNNYKFKLLESTEVVKVTKEKDRFASTTSNGDIFRSRTLILASGKKPRPLNVPGEKEFKNKGVTYCATCDAPLFPGKDVAVIGGGNSALDAALQLAKIAAKVYLINNTLELNGDKIMQEKLAKFPNVEILNNSKVVAIGGSKFVSSITINTKGTDRAIPLTGVFVEAGLIPNSDFIDIVEKNAIGEININCSAETSVEGIFAAGDVTSVPEKQIIIAAGDGAKAALSAFHYLSTH